MRATHGRRFEHGYERVEDRGDRHDEGDIGEHRRHLHAFGEMNDAVTEPGERGDGLAADDGEQRDGKAHAHPGQDDRQRRGQQDVAEELDVGCAHGAGCDHEHFIDIAEAGDGVERDGKEADGRSQRDFGGGSEPEEQDVERKEQNDRDRVDAGEQRLEHPDAILRPADEIADDDPGARRDCKRGREFGQRDAQIADEFPGLENLPKIAQHHDRVGEQQRAHAPARRGEIPERNERD